MEYSKKIIVNIVSKFSLANTGNILQMLSALCPLKYVLCQEGRGTLFKLQLF